MTPTMRSDFWWMRDVLKGEWVGCHPCINTSSLRIKTKDMFGPVIKGHAS